MCKSPLQWPTFVFTGCCTSPCFDLPVMFLQKKVALGLFDQESVKTMNAIEKNLLVWRGLFCQMNVRR